MFIKLKLGTKPLLLKQTLAIFMLIFMVLPISVLAENQTLSALDVELAQAEQGFSDIVIGTEKHIRWYQNTRQTSNIVIIYLHGFSASRQELSPVLEHVADQLKANVFFTRLTGHGRSDDAMADASVEDWKNDVREAYKFASQLGENIVLVGTSTGATLSAWAATENFAEDTKASIMISPNFGVQNRSIWLMRWSWGVKLAKWINGDYYSFTPVSEQHAKFWTERYPLEAVTPMVKLLDEVAELDKSNIEIPHLVIYSPADKVIDVDKALSTTEEFNSADMQIISFTESTDHVQHVLAGVACSPEATEPMVKILADYISDQITK